MIDGLVYKVIRKKPPWCLVGMPGGVRGRGCEAPAYLITTFKIITQAVLNHPLPAL